jgi:hypothetical protein
MGKSIFIFVILLILIFLITFVSDNFNLVTNKYSVILINHNEFQIIIIKNTNNIQDKIYKIYKN